MLNIGKRKILNNDQCEIDRSKEVKLNRINSLQTEMKEIEDKIDSLKIIKSKKEEELAKLVNMIEEKKKELSEIEKETDLSLRAMLREYYPLIQQELPSKPEEPKCNFVVAMGTKEEQKRKKKAEKETAKLRKIWKAKLIPEWETECKQIKEYNKVIDNEWHEILGLIRDLVSMMVKVSEKESKDKMATDVDIHESPIESKTNDHTEPSQKAIKRRTKMIDLVEESTDDFDTQEVIIESDNYEIIDNENELLHPTASKKLSPKKKLKDEIVHNTLPVSEKNDTITEMSEEDQLIGDTDFDLS